MAQLRDNQDTTKMYQNRTFDMWMDEESKCKAPEFIKKNERATSAWSEWQSRTGHLSLPGDFIAGNTVIYKKIKEDKVNV